jgi:hypothetical protein
MLSKVVQARAARPNRAAQSELPGSVTNVRARVKYVSRVPRSATKKASHSPS